MQPLNIQNLSQSYGFYRQFSANVFNYLNRRINIIIPCHHMEFMGERVNTVSRSFILGTNFADIIMISLLDIFRCAEDLKLQFEEELRGLIIYVIAHELSHLDQRIPFKVIKIDQAVKKQIENANEANTLHFLLEHKQELENFFGGIDFKGVYTIANSDSMSLYQRVKSLQEKIMDILEYFVDNNNQSLSQALIKNNYQNLEIHYTNFSINYSTVCNVIKNGTWLSPVYTMDFLRDNLTIKDLVKTCIWEENGVVKLIITKSTNPVSYPMNCVLNPGDKILIPVL